MIDDVAYMRTTKTRATLVPVGVFDTLVASRADDRIAIFIGLSSASTITFSPNLMTGSADGAKYSTGGPGQGWITLRDHGSAAMNEWHVWANAPDKVLIIEVFGDK